MKTYGERIRIYFEKYAEEIQAARHRGQNYAEVNQEKNQIHFCVISDDCQTPMNWGWGPDCDGFWI